MNRLATWVQLFSIAALSLGLLLATGCSERRPTAHRSKKSSAKKSYQGAQAEVLISSIASTLNDLANRADTTLVREEKILDATNSADGNEVLAVVTSNPQSLGPGNSYLQVPLNNANFQNAEVKPDDIVRLYYVDSASESSQRGFEERSFVSLKVRRLDDRNPQNALILDVDLPSPLTTPERIEIWRFSNRRAKTIRNAIENYVKLRKPPVDWAPTPDQGELELLVDTANRWLRNRTVPDDKQAPTELIATLSESLREEETLAARISRAALSSDSLAPGEGRALQEAIWLRDISSWARGDAVTDLEAASALFDWTVRNVWAVSAEEAVDIHHPWQALLYGRGTVEDRAWVFVELCRQQQIPAVVLAVSEADDSPAKFWLPAALVQGDLHLYDVRLGLPLMDSENGEVLTLAQVQANPKLVPGNDTDQDFSRVDAWVTATPFQLAGRAYLLENALEDEQLVLLRAQASAIQEKLEKLDGIRSVKLWQLPFQSVVDEHTIKISKRRLAAKAFDPFRQEPLLWKARALHFQGKLPPLRSNRKNPLAEPRLGHRDAIKLYQNERIRPTDEVLRGIPPQVRNVALQTKALASLWLGQLSYDKGRYETAQFWFESIDPDQVEDRNLVAAAGYNLARTYEQLGEFEKAATLLSSCCEDSPQHEGNLLRAQRLQQSNASEEAAN